MILALRSTLMGVALFIAVTAPASAADAIALFDEYMMRSSAITQCHPSQSAADQAFLAKAGAMRKAAVEQLWARLDAINRARHDENGKAADETIQRRRTEHDRFIQSQVVEYGCDWLEGQVFDYQRAPAR